jgi:hypothetical protein
VNKIIFTYFVFIVMKLVARLELRPLSSFIILLKQQTYLLLSYSVYIHPSELRPWEVPLL